MRSVAGERYFLESLDRGLAVLECFDEQHRERTLSEVAQVVGITRSTTRRILLTLVDRGFLRQEGRRFMLTPRVLRFGFSYLSGLALPQLAEPHLAKLAAELEETVSVTVLDGSDALYVARVRSPRIVRIAISVGMRFPAYATSHGRVLLSGLTADELDRYLETTELRAFTEQTLVDRDRLRAEILTTAERGWALSEDELELGVRGVAVPIRDRTGRIVAALNSSLQNIAHSGADVEARVVSRLQEAAQRIGADLAISGP